MHANLNSDELITNGPIRYEKGETHMDNDIDDVRRRMMEEIRKGSGDNDGRPIDLNGMSFQKFITEPTLGLIDFWAAWCAPCRFVSPVVEQLARDYKGKVRFGKVNVDENQNIAARFNIRSIPTLMLFKGGKVVDYIIGAVPRNQIEQKILKHING